MIIVHKKLSLKILDSGAVLLYNGSRGCRTAVIIAPKFEIVTIFSGESGSQPDIYRRITDSTDGRIHFFTEFGRNDHDRSAGTAVYKEL